VQISGVGTFDFPYLSTGAEILIRTWRVQNQGSTWTLATFSYPTYVLSTLGQWTGRLWGWKFLLFPLSFLWLITSFARFHYYKWIVQLRMFIQRKASQKLEKQQWTASYLSLNWSKMNGTRNNCFWAVSWI
jgi:hypothetical protein